MKYLIWIVLAAVIVLWLLHGKKARIKSASSAPHQAENGTEAILQCAGCGVHIPQSEAITTVNGLVFCSEEHRLRHTSS